MAQVLIVDDDPRTLDVLDIALRLEGHDTIRAVNGREALDLADRHVPDLFLLDSMMPELDGIEVARALRGDSRFRQTPVIMATARALDADIWAGWQAGVDSYLTKPLDLRMLQQELARLGFAALPKQEVA